MFLTRDTLASLPACGCWNNSLKDNHISELPDSYHEYLESCIPRFCPRPNKVRFFFEMYDAEEGRL